MSILTGYLIGGAVVSAWPFALCYRYRKAKKIKIKYTLRAMIIRFVLWPGWALQVLNSMLWLFTALVLGVTVEAEEQCK
jgi:hypothetical protein